MRTNPPDAWEPARRPRAGATLVEVMIACVILLVMAVGGAAYLYQSGAILVTQRNKRVALETGNTRLEEIRATGYTALTALVPTDYDVHYLRKVGGSWQV